MPIQGSGWELLIERSREDQRAGRRRTVGKYKVFHNGKAVDALTGAMAESPGPGDNSRPGNKKRVEAGAVSPGNAGRKQIRHPQFHQ